ncbi:hypothetical protein [Amycolatopsis sp. PS_44_ISF1]|uniref:hypothetical protein n=1 Tax=Amycolatopsis sp. PS_44_ISF1 TaxID=2974917 RepID=UPI0028E03F0A|nr:hypothetical protein [Amycolatopsis sp. PS_44_ISF1]MDT8913583.1 hypothetical protein [Amycolatopsis sp. PS_44_ISF1]
MTDDHDMRDMRMPKFNARIVPTSQIRNEHLDELVKRYRQGEDTPLFFGDGNQPEAAVIPFRVLMVLMKRQFADHEKNERTFRDELSNRIKNADTRRAAGEADVNVTVRQLAEGLGSVGREWAEKRNSARSGQADCDG